MASEQVGAANAGRTGEVSQALLDRLQDVLLLYPGPGAEDGELRRALRAIGAEARSSGIKAEQLVTSLKRVFDAVIPPATTAGSRERAARLGHLVTTCVREYYATESGDQATGESDGGSGAAT